MSVTRPLAVDNAAKKILKPENLNRYLTAVSGTDVPAIFIGALDLREGDCNPRLALGQGDPWNQRSSHVPRGLGPFSSWTAAAKFYIRYDHLDDNTQPWSMEYACYKGECWNGFGPRAHGRRTGYLWAGTSLYDPPTGLGGKYTTDNNWDPHTIDPQLGIIPVLMRIAQLRPDLAIAHADPFYQASLLPPIAPISVPEGLGENPISVKQMQHMLNVVNNANLDEDGSYGRNTRSAVRAYQTVKRLSADGLCGPLTLTVLEKDFKVQTGE